MKNPLEKPNKAEKPLYICVCSQWIFGEIVTRDVTRTSVLAFVSSVRSPLTSSSLVQTVLPKSVCTVQVVQHNCQGVWCSTRLSRRVLQPVQPKTVICSSVCVAQAAAGSPQLNQSHVVVRLHLLIWSNCRKFSPFGNNSVVCRVAPKGTTVMSQRATNC